LYNAQGRPWSNTTIHELLRNEKYMGNMLWNRRSQKLHASYVRNPETRWVRAVGAFEPIVDTVVFDAAQARLDRFKSKADEHQVLASISRLLQKTGHLNLRTIKQQLDIPGRTRVRRVLPSLEDAYLQVGYFPALDIAYVDHRITVKKMMAQHVLDVIAQLEASGHLVERDDKLSTLCIDQELRIKVCATLGCKESTFQPYAKAAKSARFYADLVLVGYFPRPQLQLKCFYLLPESVLDDCVQTTLSPYHVPGVGGFRVDDLSLLITLCARVPIEVPDELSDDNQHR